MHWSTVTVKIPVMRKTHTRGSQLHVTCRSVYNRDWNGIKQDLIENQHDLPNDKNQGINDTNYIKRHIYHFVFWTTVNQVIKSFERGQRSDQVLISPTRFQSQTLWKATYQWLTLDLALVHILTHNTSQQRYVHACMNVVWNFFWPNWAPVVSSCSHTFAVRSCSDLRAPLL